MKFKGTIRSRITAILLCCPLDIITLPIFFFMFCTDSYSLPVRILRKIMNMKEGLCEIIYRDLCGLDYDRIYF